LSSIRWGFLIFCLLSAACARRAAPHKVAIAAAADLNFALEEVSREFRSAHPDVDLETAYGSSGNFYAQIRNQAPFDVFLSADVEYPRKLVEDGIGARDSLFVYAVGRIVVWVPAASPLDPSTALRATSVRHVAIANPGHAPYGRAAEAALRSLGLYDSVAGNWCSARTSPRRCNLSKAARRRWASWLSHWRWRHRSVPRDAIGESLWRLTRESNRAASS